MSTTTRRLPRRALAVTAVTVALASAAGTAFATGNPSPAAHAADTAARAFQAQQARPAAQAAPRAATVSTPTYPLVLVNKKTKKMSHFGPNGSGGFGKRTDTGEDWSDVKSVLFDDSNKDGYVDGNWVVLSDGYLGYGNENGGWARGSGWSTYRVSSPGDLGHSRDADLFAIDKTGVAWLYLGRPNGAIGVRVRLGSGWNNFTQIAGQGDLTGDGKADVVARDKSGNLFLYAGTGNYKAPLAKAVKIATGWNGWNRIFSVGDYDFDGLSDLMARNSAGEIYRFSGTGNAKAPLAKGVKIGTGFNAYDIIN
ncbi:VCBS repeat-containing protein [Streptomyces sp. NPDC001941]|uniref:FG-GAP repeat domain-containing protein n=1 Tax=Streptomyces sp. NPDC001941 TaxID=3154659 RepID=UPI0033241E32